CQPEGERGDAVDDHEGVPDDRGLDRCRAAGDYAGVGVIEGVAGVGDEADVEGPQGLIGVCRPPLVVPGDVVCQLFAIDGRGYWQNIVVTKRVAVCHLDHDFEVRSDLLPPAAGQKGDPFPCRVQTVSGGVLFAGDGGLRQLRQRVADELSVDAAGTVEAFFKGKDDHHAGDALLHPAEAAALPGPELRTDEVNDRDAEFFELAGEAEVDVGEVDQDGDIGAPLPDGSHEA